MKKYYIIRADGSSIFEQAYSKDFIFHCLINLLDRSEERYRLLWFDNIASSPTVQVESAIAAVERITELERENI